MNCKTKIMAVAQKYGQKYHVKIDEDFALLKLYEEVGELAQAILIHHKKVGRKNTLTSGSPNKWSPRS